METIDPGAVRNRGEPEILILGEIPISGPFHLLFEKDARLVSASVDRDRLHFPAVDVEIDRGGFDPFGAGNLYLEADRIVIHGNEISGAEFAIDGEIDEQAVADQNPSLGHGLGRLIDVNLSGIGIIDANVGSTLSYKMANHIVRIAASDGSDGVASVEQSHPVAQEFEGIRLGGA